MGEHYELVGEWDAPVPLTLTPLEYFQRQCYVSMDADEEPALNVLHAIGENQVVFSTDYPHGDSKFPKSVDIFLNMSGISDSLRRKILWDNCAALYNIRS